MFRSRANTHCVWTVEKLFYIVTISCDVRKINMLEAKAESTSFAFQLQSTWQFSI